MIFLRGLGIWVLYGPLLFGGLFGYLMEKFAPHAGRKAAAWMLIGTLASSAVLAFGIAIHAHHQQPKWRVEQRTGRESFSRPIHTVFGLGVEYWGSFYAAVAFLVFLKVLRP